MDYRKQKLKRKESLILVAVIEAALMVIGFLFYDSFVPVLAGPLLFIPVKKEYCRYKEKDRSIRLRAGFKDMLYSMSSSFLAGRHMRESVKVAKTELSQMYSPADPIMVEIDRLIDDMEQPEMSENKALAEFQKKNDQEDIRDFVAAYGLMVKSGGDMASMMNRCAGIIGEKIMAEEEIKEIVSQRKMEGMMITLMPAVVILFLKISSPGYLQVMYGTVPGVSVMTIVLLIIYLAYRAMERITDIDV